MTPDASTPRMQRAPALDALRAIAILLVFAYHYAVFVSREWTFGWLSQVGWIGVDLFFVLSGYLIGSLVLRERAAFDGRLDLGRFYARRACRTLPAYLLTLAAYTLWREALGGAPPPPLWRFLTFTQNLGLQPGTAFSHAWSLCIEEQFYALLPLVALAWGRGAAWRRRAWTTIVLGIAIGMTSRAVAWMSVGPAAFGDTNQYYPRLYYASLCRFDALLPGLAVALLQHAHPRAWAAVQARARALTLTALAAVAASAWGVLNFQFDEQTGYGAVMSIAGYSTTALSFALLLAAARCEGAPLQRLDFPGAAALARWSYSLYLSHKAVGHALGGALTAAGAGPGLRLLLVSLASLAVGAAMYRCVERPFLQWRDRRWPAPSRMPMTTPVAATSAVPGVDAAAG